MKSIESRYGGLTPNSISDDGTVVATPVYITLNQERKKELMNAFRRIKTEQLIQAGWSDTSVSTSGIKVIDSTASPLTPIEMAAGFAEEELRMHLFSKTGLAEKTLLKLGALCGIELISREQLLQSFTNWIDYVLDHTTAPPSGKKRKASPSFKTSGSSKRSETVPA